MLVELRRGSIVESRHRVHVAVVDGDGRLVARAGDPDVITFWRSAAKPFQAMPLVTDGAADRFGLTRAELALCCASHSSEQGQVALVRDFLAKIGCTERDLLCGPHTPLSPAVAKDYETRGVRLTAVYSNCSGKHTGMLALARHHDWPLAVIVFTASVFVPVLKIAILCFLLVSVHRRSRWRPAERTRLYRITEMIGRWSMVDIFVITILVALVRLGSLASIDAKPGAIFFGAVVVLTMLAAESFDPRLIWDTSARIHGSVGRRA